jgi:thiol-disulfide isomerase/thioredoxin
MAMNVKEDTSEIVAADIEEGFVAKARAEVVGVEVDGEAILLLEGTRELHALNPTGTLIWGLLDGVSTLDEIVADLAAVYHADLQVVRNDVLELTRGLGRAGLLIGVAKEEPVHVPTSPKGLAEGTEVPDFRFPALDGQPLALEDLRGKRTLLVNWSPRCGFCVKIAPELAEIETVLSEHDVRLVFLTIGSEEENRELVESNGLRSTVLLQDGDQSIVFGGLGTPAAYLIDEAGKVASTLALGANEVPVLARQAAR